MDSRQLSMDLLFVFILLIQFQIGSPSDWNYSDKGPDVWPDLYPLCGGTQQSPIDIQRSCTIYRAYSPVKLSVDYYKTTAFRLLNNGHTITATLVNGNKSLLTVTGGGLGGTYQFSSFHFHWGQNYASGSEHFIDGKKYPAEFHLVHQNIATGKLSVLGFLVKSDRGENDGNDTVSKTWRTHFTAGSKLTEEGNTTIVNMNLGLLMRDYLEKFWVYQGALTTPPCTEGVKWIVFTKPMKIYDKNLQKFRSKVAELNFREPVPLYDRKVYRNFGEKDDSNQCDFCK